MELFRECSFHPLNVQNCSEILRQVSQKEYDVSTGEGHSP